MYTETHPHHKMPTNNEVETPHEHEARTENKTISIKIPKIKLPTLQSGVLILLITVGILQTVQLYGLDRQIAKSNIGAKTNATSTSSPPSSVNGSVTSSLPKMVGGC